MTRPSWVAYFDSECEACGSEIYAGAKAIWNDHHQIVHLACADTEREEQ